MKCHLLCIAFEPLMSLAWRTLFVSGNGIRKVLKATLCPQILKCLKCLLNSIPVTKLKYLVFKNIQSKSTVVLRNAIDEPPSEYIELNTTASQYDILQDPSNPSLNYLLRIKMSTFQYLWVCSYWFSVQCKVSSSNFILSNNSLSFLPDIGFWFLEGASSKCSAMSLLHSPPLKLPTYVLFIGIVSVVKELPTCEEPCFSLVNNLVISSGQV